VRSKASQLVAEYRTATLQTLAVVDALSEGTGATRRPQTIRVSCPRGSSWSNREAQLRQAVGQAARAGAHFYTLDARGLNKGTNAGLIDQAFVDNAAGAPGRFDMQSDGMNSLAVDTGGFAIYNENNFGRALDEIQRDAGTYYVLSYTRRTPADPVKVARPDVVRARRSCQDRSRPAHRRNRRPGRLSAAMDQLPACGQTEWGRDGAGATCRSDLTWSGRAAGSPDSRTGRPCRHGHITGRGWRAGANRRRDDGAGAWKGLQRRDRPGAAWLGGVRKG
jgi:hypothetical protein